MSQTSQNDFRKRNTIHKYSEIFFIKIYLSIKAIKEYKTNTALDFFTTITLSASFLIFYFIYQKELVPFLNWEYYDFIIYFFLLLYASLILRFFILTNFKYTLTSGKLNEYIVKPISPLYFTLINGHRPTIILSATIYTIILTILITYGKYSNYLISFTIFLFGYISHTIIMNMILSLAFFIKESGIIYDIYYRNTFFTVEQFTPKLFEQSFLRFFAFLIPAAYYGYFVIESLKGRFNELIYYFPFMLIITIICSITLFTLWHYGLRKYEAFG